MTTLILLKSGCKCVYFAFKDETKRWKNCRFSDSVGHTFRFVTHFRYKNIPHMSFDDTGREPEQAFRLNRDPLAELEYPTKWVRRSQCSFCAGFAASLKAPPPWWKHEHGKFQQYHRRNHFSVFLSGIWFRLSCKHNKTRLVLDARCLSVLLPLELEHALPKLKRRSLSSPLTPKDCTFFQRPTPVDPHLEELWRGEHQGLLHRFEGRVFWGNLRHLNPQNSDAPVLLHQWIISILCKTRIFSYFSQSLSTFFFLSLWFQAHRHEVTICNYEASANPADHKVESIIPQTNFISWQPWRSGGVEEVAGWRLPDRSRKIQTWVERCVTYRLVELQWDSTPGMWKAESVRSVGKFSSFSSNTVWRLKCFLLKMHGTYFDILYCL